MYVITGATGNIGRAIAESLLTRGEAVRVIGRDAAKLKALADLGAEVRAGSLADAAFLHEAFAGATAVFVMTPPAVVAENVRARASEVGTAIAGALAANKVSHVVHLSSLGGDLSEGTGPVLGAHDQEERLARIEGLHVLHLRPTYFMENLLGNIGLIQSAGINGGPLRADLSFPLIATRDIAAAAVEELVGREFTGSSHRVLLGAEDFTMAEITRRIGRAIGRPELAYLQFPYEQTVEAMVGMGLSRDAAQGLVDLNRTMNEERGIVAMPRDARSATPTTLDQFIDSVFVPAFRGGQTAAAS